MINDFISQKTTDLYFVLLPRSYQSVGSVQQKNPLNFDETVSFDSFVQGWEGNCGMIAAMASLATNKQFYDEAVPEGQRYARDRPAEFAFNLYKNGRRHLVKVDDKVNFYRPIFSKNMIKYASSRNGSVVGPLLEKALVKLLFSGSYKSSASVYPYTVLTSLSSNLCETFLDGSNVLEMSDVINHGVKTKSLMVVSFKNSSFRLGIQDRHSYTLVGSNEDSTRLYDPHGKVLEVPTSSFLKNLLMLDICYCDNSILGFPKTTAVEEIQEFWPALSRNHRVSFVEYDLLVQEDDTKILVNLVDSVFDGFCRHIFVLDSSKNKSIVNFSSPNVYRRLCSNSLRVNLNEGKYKIVLTISQQFNMLERLFISQKYFPR